MTIRLIDISATFKTSKSFLALASLLTCLFLSSKLTLFLFTYHFFFLIFCLALSYFLLAVSLSILSKTAILFSIINLTLWFGIQIHDY